MDVNPHVVELRKMADFIDKIGSGDYVEGEGHILRAAAAEIEHLERYAQHYPTCRLVYARQHSLGQPGDDLCSCGLVRPAAAKRPGEDS